MARYVSMLQPGRPDVLVQVDAPIADPAEGQVLVRNHAVGVNFIDTLIRQAALPTDMMPPMPHVLGVEGCGTVEAVGLGVTSVAIGDEVAWMGPLGSGGYSSHSLLHENWLTKLPAGTAPYEAAALPVNGVTAWHMLVNLARVTEGSTVLVHSAAGGVGTMAVQLAKHLGATVIGSTSTHKTNYVQSLGTDHVLDYTKDDIPDRVLEITGGRGVDASLNPIGGNTVLRDLRVLAPSGTLVLFGFLGGVPTGSLTELATHFGRSIGVRLSDIYTHFSESPASFRADLAKVATLHARRVLKPHIERVFPLEAAALAHELLESRRMVGKLVLSIE